MHTPGTAAGEQTAVGQQPKPRPGVQPWPVRAGAGGVFLPGVCRDLRGQRIDADRAGMGGHAPVGRHRHHVAQSVASNGCAQSWVGSVGFVAGHPPRGYSGAHSALDQCCRQRWFGRETPLVGGDSGVGAAIMVLGPAARNLIEETLDAYSSTPANVVPSTPGAPSLRRTITHARHRTSLR
jgi:hypothetical protein